MNNLIKTLAERVMGINGDNPFDLFIEDGKVYQHHAEDLSEPWEPTRDWNDCMGMVEQMRSEGFSFYLSDGHLIDGEVKTRVEFYKDAKRPSEIQIGVCFDKDLKKAICIVAAKALGLEWE